MSHLSGDWQTKPVRQTFPFVPNFSLLNIWSLTAFGPLPTSKAGNMYLFTVMCLNKRYPAAYHVRNITAKSVIQALTQFISVFDIPKIIQSDQGTNFTSHMFGEIMKQLTAQSQQEWEFDLFQFIVRYEILENMLTKTKDSWCVRIL